MLLLLQLLFFVVVAVIIGTLLETERGFANLFVTAKGLSRRLLFECGYVPLAIDGFGGLGFGIRVRVCVRVAIGGCHGEHGLSLTLSFKILPVIYWVSFVKLSWNAAASTKATDTGKGGESRCATIWWRMTGC